jgi:hypothetical protein
MRTARSADERQKRIRFVILLLRALLAVGTTFMSLSCAAVSARARDPDRGTESPGHAPDRRRHDLHPAGDLLR